MYKYYIVIENVLASCRSEGVYVISTVAQIKDKADTFNHFTLIVHVNNYVFGSFNINIYMLDKEYLVISFTWLVLLLSIWFNKNKMLFHAKPIGIPGSVSYESTMTKRDRQSIS